MAFKVGTLTLSGTGANRLTTTHTPVRQIQFFNVTGNGTLLVGDKNLSATVYGMSVAAATVSPLVGPFAGELPINLEDFYLQGSDTNVIRYWYVT